MTPAVFVALLVGVVGLAVGSFLNVVVHRVPAGISVVAPPSACPRCGHGIRRRDNVPVVSWLLLRGRCRDCSTAIPKRYPLVEAATAALFVLVVLRAAPPLVAATDPRAAAAATVGLVVLLYLMAVSVALALIDLDVHRLPNAIVLPAYVVCAVLLVARSALTGDWAALVRGGIGLVAMGGGYLALAVAVPGGMGLGDVKLAGVLGLVLAYLGWGPLAVGASGAFLLGGTFAIGLLATGRARRGTGIPFGPWMLGGAWLGVFLGQPVLDAYLHITGLA
ncbi:MULTISPECIES: A24 family peptidase [unclassified Curtobacterium]|uniref:prepilin peptidase n=1 Tax=unclassified Curtobacterium TaxID=257496 RepID=UPI00082492AB|nr:MULTISPECIES: A24 family peptidase [unclassified Curtobacterium]WIA96636.1 prepilin peptidase [Curtobacterium sp. MCBA15_004]WIA99942.1 prepilin peptidase [Curtobacterium sp. MCBA15_012]